MALRFALVATLAIGFGQQDLQNPYSGVAVQLLDEECPHAPPSAVPHWQALTVAALEARTHYVGQSGAQNRAAALAHYLEALLQLFTSGLEAAFQCPAVAAHHLQVVAEWSLALDQPLRARVLVHLGNAFKFQALKQWAQLQHLATAASKQNGGAPVQSSGPKTFLPRLHVEYQIVLGQLHEALQTKPATLLRWPRAEGEGGSGSAVTAAMRSDRDQRPSVEIHSICAYKPDETSKTGADSPLPGLSVPNHQAYADRHGYRYVVHTKLPLPDVEAHYSKMFVIFNRFTETASVAENSPTPDWILFVDCDAFFTNFDVSIHDLLWTYAGREEARGPGDGGTHFIVAEDPGGINTGVFLVRNSPWSLDFLARVSRSLFTVAWDQSMFFWEIVRSALDMNLEAFQADFRYPTEVKLVHQAHLNAFVPPASRDWMAHEWRPGDFVRHFAGCPWQEPHCLKMMQETAAAAGTPQK